MNNIEKAADIVEALHRNDQLEGDGVVGCFDATAAAQALADAGLLAPGPQIIRTAEELEALNPDTLVMSRKGYLAHAEDNIRIPSVVIATGDQVRAARKALEEA